MSIHTTFTDLSSTLDKLKTNLLRPQIKGLVLLALIVLADLLTLDGVDHGQDGGDGLAHHLTVSRDTVTRRDENETRPIFFFCV